MIKKGFNLIHKDDLVKQVKSRIEIYRRLGMTEAIQALEDLLKAYE